MIKDNGDNKMDTKQYFSIASYQGNSNKELYTVFTLNSNTLDDKTSTQVREDFKKFFDESIDTKVNTQGNLAVDLKNVDYMDTSGLAALLVLNRLNMHKYGKVIKLANCQKKVLDLINNTGLDAVIGIVPDLEEL